MKRKTEKDYHLLADSRGFKWVGEVLPEGGVLEKTWWECCKGHRWKAQYSSIYSGNRCPYCSGQARKTVDDYHNLAKQKGLKWWGVKLPKNGKTNTLWLCNKNHKFKARYSNINNSIGNGCIYCARINRRKTKKDYYNLASEKGFMWVGIELPKSNKTKTWWKCKNGHRFKSGYCSIYNGFGCPYCVGLAKKTEKDYHNLAKNRGFKWVGRVLPKNVHTKTTWECKKGHRWKAIYGNIYMKTGCPFCKNFINSAPISKPQVRLNNLLYGSLNYPEAKYRIDVAIIRKSQKIAIEYDAQYWHKGREEQDAKRDSFLISRGWKILHIKSGNLLPKRKQLKNVINCLLNTSNKVYNLYLEDWK